MNISMETKFSWPNSPVLDHNKICLPRSATYFLCLIQHINDFDRLELIDSTSIFFSKIKIKLLFLFLVVLE